MGIHEDRANKKCTVEGDPHFADHQDEKLYLGKTEIFVTFRNTIFMTVLSPNTSVQAMLVLRCDRWPLFCVLGKGANSSWTAPNE